VQSKIGLDSYCGRGGCRLQLAYRAQELLMFAALIDLVWAERTHAFLGS